jgi:hypothetical protein
MPRCLDWRLKKKRQREGVERRMLEQALSPTTLE